LEYLPDPGVARRGSRLFQRISVTADRDSTLILGQTLLPGRVAHGGAHVYDPYCSETEVRRSDGVLFLDVVRLGSADRHPKSIGLLGEHDVVATLYVISRRTDPITMVEGLRTALESCLDVLDGVSELPNGCGVAVRLLGSTSKAVQTARATAWIAAHLELLGTAAPHLRRGWPGPPVLTPPPPPVRSHSTDVGRDHARLSWRSWKIRMHNVPHNVPVMKRSSSTTPSTMTK
jgi:urease accessory protein